MTGRERLQAVFDRRPTDRLPWTVLVDADSLAQCPSSLRGNGGIDLYRHLDCDVLLLNGWNTSHTLKSPTLIWDDTVRTELQEEGAKLIRRWHTGKDTLTTVWDRGVQISFPVDSIETLCAYRRMWETAVFRECDDRAVTHQLDALLGASGIFTRFWGPSTIPRLLENDMGVEQFYFIRHDYPEEMEALISIMHARELEAFSCLARGPWDSVTLCENTSTLYISPDLYARYNMPHQKDFVEAVHAARKTALLHMCGHVRDILDLVAQTGCDGIHALTPPPTGDTPWT